MLKKVCFTIIGVLMIGQAAWAQEIQVQSVSFTSLSDSAAGFSDFVQQSSSKKTIDDNVLGKRSSGDTLSVRDFGFKSLVGNIDANTLAAATQALQTASDEALRVTSTPLCFPNPFRQETGTELRYYLNQNGAVDIYIYDMLSNLVFKQSMPSGSNGGRAGLNYCKVSSELLQGYQLSAGVYFVFLMNNGKVLSKVKMAVIP